MAKGRTQAEMRQRAKEVAEMPLPEIPPLKACAGTCGLTCELPQAPDFFDVDQGNPDGFKKVCKQCRKERRQMLKVKSHREKRARVDSLIAKLIDRAQFGGSDVPHIAEVYAKIVALMGGSNGFAMAFLDTYIYAERGGAVRQRLLNQLGNMGTAVTATGAAEIPNELLSPEELDKKISRLAKQAKVVDSTATNAPAKRKGRRNG